MTLYVPKVPQAIFVQHLLRNPNAMGFVGCGLGKSATTLDALDRLFQNAATHGALIVAPRRVVALTWPDEIAKWKQFRWMEHVTLNNPEGWAKFAKGDAHIYLINYERLPELNAKTKTLRKRCKPKLPFDTVVWDEMSACKSHASSRINAVRRPFQKLLKRHWGFTGTPISNNYMNLFAMCRTIDGGKRLGTAFEAFQRLYFEPTDYMEYNWELKAGAREIIESKIADITCVLRTSDWLDMPDIEYTDIEISMPPEVAKTYRTLEKEYLADIGGGEVAAQSAGILVNKLLQLTSGNVYDDERFVRRLHTLKLEALKKLVKTFKTPALIVVWFKHELQMLREVFPDLPAIQDCPNDKALAALKDKWNRREVPLMAIHPLSGGHGLNVQFGGETLVWYSFPWSPEWVEQTEKRLHRPGQQNIVKVFRLVMKDTIDEIVLEVQRRKDGENQALQSALNYLRKKALLR